jgi:hypothetical protein
VPNDDALGIYVNNLEIWANGVLLAGLEPATSPPVLATSEGVWRWANFPQYPHLVDWWLVLLHDAALPRRVIALLTAGVIGTAGALLFVCIYRPRKSETAA